MSYATQILRKGLRRVLIAQASLTLAVAVGAALSASHHDALRPVVAALAGGAIAMLGALVLAYSVGRADGKLGAAQAQLWLYGGAVARFVFAIVFLGLGLGVFHVAPLPFLVAFGLGQVAFLAPGISSGL
ncbi:MAG: ATP synthase subunit I [Acidiferrobacter sp.]